jgi:hypothetical protein
LPQCEGPLSPLSCQRAEHRINVLFDLVSHIGSGRTAMKSEIVCELLDAFEVSRHGEALR